MNKRENLLSLLKRKGFEHIPVSFGLCPELYEKVAKEVDFNTLNVPWRNISDMKIKEYDLGNYKKYYKKLQSGAHIDQWGVAHEKGSQSAKHMTRMRHPLKGIDSLNAIKEYQFPEFLPNEQMQKQDAENCIKDGIASIGAMQMTIWETSWYIRSMEDLMMDMLSDDPIAEFILDKVTELNTQRAVAFAKAGADIVYLGDDIGMQKQIMMSKDLYQTWLKPRLKALIKAAKAANPNVLIAYHSCGYITPFIGDLIEVGVDILNPIQPECMNFEEIYHEFGGALSFEGTIGTQTTMPFGTPLDVRKEVFKNLDIAGKKGGLFPSPTHLLEPEVPVENVIAYIKACKEYC